MTLSGFDEGVFKDLMTALLAVNSWSLERAYSVVQQFATVGLTDPAEVSRMDASAVAERLQEAGYQRGHYITLLIATRVLHAALALATDGFERIGRHEAAGDIANVKAFLLSIHGVGPQVVRTFLALRRQDT